MNRRTAFLELKQLATEATTVLGIRRAAMIAGCHPSTLRPWLRRPFMLVHAATIDRALPRLRQWHRWVSGYVAETAEIRRLEMEAPSRSHELVDELRRRLKAATAQYTVSYIAHGCEVSERDLLHWLLGRTTRHQYLRMVQALGHLRHMSDWPTMPSAQSAEPDRIAANF